MTPPALQPMGIRGILVAVLRLYGRRFTTFVAIAAVVEVPYAFLMAILASLARRVAPESAPDGSDNGFFNVSTLLPDLAHAAGAHGGGIALGSLPLQQTFAASVLGLIVIALTTLVALLVFMSLVYPLVTGALVVNISALYLGEELGAAQSFGRAFRRLGHLLFAQFLATLFAFLGFLLLLVPGLLAMLWFSLVPVVALLEDRSAMQTLGRSRSLMTDNLGRASGLGLVLGLLHFAFGSVTGALIGAVPWPSAFIGDFLADLATGLLLPVQMGAIVLFYYDLRIRKEGFDLQFLASRMDAYGVREERSP